MKAYILEGDFGIDNLRLNDLPEPDPGPHEVVVHVKACSLNYRDLMTVKGQYDPNLELPMTPLSDCAGEVAAVGPNVTRVRTGDRVAGAFMQGWLDGPLTREKAGTALGGDLPGVLARHVVLHEEGLVHLPDDLEYEEAATLPCAGVTAWNALFGDRPIEAGQTVLTLGTGGVSSFALLFARAAGAKVVITSSSDDKLGRMRSLGADETINYEKVPDWHRLVKEKTGGHGADRIVETGGGQTLNESIQAAGPEAEIAVIGVLTGVEAQFGIVPLLVKSVRLRGIYVGSRAMFEAMLAFMATHDIHPLVHDTVPFEEAPEAFRMLERADHVGKIVIRVP